MFLIGGFDNDCDFWDEIIDSGLKESRQALYPYFGYDAKLIGEFELPTVVRKVLEDDKRYIKQFKKGLEVRKKQIYMKRKRDAMDTRFANVFGLKIMEVK